MLLKILARFVLIGDSSVGIFDRIKYALMVIGSFAPVAYVLNFLDLWIQDNHQFTLFISASLFINAVIGAVAHLKGGTFSYPRFIYGNLLMILIVVSGGFTLDMFRMTVGDNMVGDGFRLFLQVTTLMYPCSKIFKNIFILSNGKFPPEEVMKRIYNFEKNGDLKAFFSTDSNRREPGPDTGDFI